MTTGSSSSGPGSGSAESSGDTMDTPLGHQQRGREQEREQEISSGGGTSALPDWVVSAVPLLLPPSPKSTDNKESGGSKGREATVVALARTGNNAASSSDRTSPESSDRTVTITMKRKQELEKDSGDAKRCKTMMNSMAEDYICPITKEMPLDPVTAEDGRVYERSAIERHIARHIERQGADQKSPMTGEPMGSMLSPAVQRSLVASGAVTEELAKPWKQKIEDEATVEATRKKANERDTDAMCDLGVWYKGGLNGLLVDRVVAYEWYKKAADLYSADGMATAGRMLVRGDGVKQDVSHGTVLVGMAAAMGSDRAAFLMGYYYLKGSCMPRDVSQARYWLRKVVDGSCSDKRLATANKKRAADYLRELDGN